MKRHTTPCSALLALAVLGTAASSCSGSSSETPWPVQPVDTDPAPMGEARPGSGDANGPLATAGTPAEDEEPEDEEPGDEEPGDEEPGDEP